MVRGWFSVRACLIASVAGLALLWRSPSAGEPSPMTDGQLDEVCLNEIFPKPCDGASEFVELYNPTGAVVEIGGWAVEVRKEPWPPVRYALP